jgi:hypothetical protein
MLDYCSVPVFVFKATKLNCNGQFHGRDYFGIILNAWELPYSNHVLINICDLLTLNPSIIM